MNRCTDSIHIPSIVTIESSNHHVLRTKTEDFRKDEFDKAREIAEKLFAAIKPRLPAAGLAAPQIGYGRSIFIFSGNRKDFEVVINPMIVAKNNETVIGWEACFSTILTEQTKRLAKVERAESIEVVYTNLSGEEVKKTLNGFAAKVFQHEFDHLQGVLNIDRKEAEVKEFSTKEEMESFLQPVRKEDSGRYS